MARRGLKRRSVPAAPSWPAVTALWCARCSAQVILLQGDAIDVAKDAGRSVVLGRRMEELTAAASSKAGDEIQLLHEQPSDKEDRFAQCVDSAGVAVSSLGFSCAHWTEFSTACSYSSFYDDDDFTARVMCCACDDTDRRLSDVAAGCGALSAGATGRWWTAASDAAGTRLQSGIGASAAAHAACQTLCQGQGVAGVCAFKNGFGGECWFSASGVIIDYATRYGWSDTNHLATECAPSHHCEYSYHEDLYCSTYGWEGNEHHSYSSLTEALSACSAKPGCGGVAQLSCGSGEYLFCGLAGFGLEYYGPSQCTYQKRSEYLCEYTFDSARYCSTYGWEGNAHHPYSSVTEALSACSAKPGCGGVAQWYCGAGEYLFCGLAGFGLGIYHNSSSHCTYQKNLAVAVGCPEHSVGTDTLGGCACIAGYLGTISATATAPFYSGLCQAVGCPTYSSGTDVPSGCTCNAGFSGTITPASNDQRYSGQCQAVECPTHSSGTDVPSGCTCNAGFSGTITPASNDQRYSGQCQAVGCPTYSSGTDVPSGCTCNAGFSGTITSASNDQRYSGQCQAVGCPAHSSGTSVPSGCTCNAGYVGTIIPASNAPFYSGQCQTTTTSTRTTRSLTSITSISTTATSTSWTWTSTSVSTTTRTSTTATSVTDSTTSLTATTPTSTISSGTDTGTSLTETSSSRTTYTVTMTTATSLTDTTTTLTGTTSTPTVSSRTSTGTSPTSTSSSSTTYTTVTSITATSVSITNTSQSITSTSWTSSTTDTSTTTSVTKTSRTLTTETGTSTSTWTASGTSTTTATSRTGTSTTLSFTRTTSTTFTHPERPGAEAVRQFEIGLVDELLASGQDSVAIAETGVIGIAQRVNITADEPIRVGITDNESSTETSTEIPVSVFASLNVTTAIVIATAVDVDAFVAGTAQASGAPATAAVSEKVETRRVMGLSIATEAGIVRVSGLREPIVIRFSEGGGANSCGFWDERALTWVRDGMETRLGADGSIECLTYHLTIFGALWRGFVSAFECNQASLLSAESLEELWRGAWVEQASTIVLCWLCSLLSILVAVACALDVVDRSRGEWCDADFLIEPHLEEEVQFHLSASEQCSGGLGSAEVAASTGDFTWREMVKELSEELLENLSHFISVFEALVEAFQEAWAEGPKAGLLFAARATLRRSISSHATGVHFIHGEDAKLLLGSQATLDELDDNSAKDLQAEDQSQPVPAGGPAARRGQGSATEAARPSAESPLLLAPAPTAPAEEAPSKEAVRIMLAAARALEEQGLDGEPAGGAAPGRARPARGPALEEAAGLESADQQDSPPPGALGSEASGPDRGAARAAAAAGEGSPREQASLGEEASQELPAAHGRPGSSPRRVCCRSREQRRDALRAFRSRHHTQSLATLATRHPWEYGRRHKHLDDLQKMLRDTHDDYVGAITCCSMPLMLFNSLVMHSPIGHIFARSIRKPRSVRAVLFSTQILGALMVQTLLFEATGLALSKRSSAQCTESCEDTGGDHCAWETIGQKLGIALISTLVAAIPLMLLGSLHHRHLRRVKNARHKRLQIRVWILQDTVMWVVSILYCAFAVCYCALFFANVGPADQLEWMWATSATVLMECVVIPIATAVVLPATAFAMIALVMCCHRHSLTDAFHRVQRLSSSNHFDKAAGEKGQGPDRRPGVVADEAEEPVSREVPSIHASADAASSSVPLQLVAGCCLPPATPRQVLEEAAAARRGFRLAIPRHGAPCGALGPATPAALFAGEILRL